MWDGKQIKKLRKRLGWSQVEMSRYLGCRRQILIEWEDDRAGADPDVISQLNYLIGHANSVSDTLSQLPQAEAMMNEKGLKQITREDVLIFTEKEKLK